jgi:mannose-6-phosphate isomerase-like protein (cupin superfamily)
MISKSKAEHYVWGQGCDGWHLLKSTGLSVIRERMLPGAAEVRHFHHTARQFFFILSGAATLEVGGRRETLRAQEGVEVPPGVPHQNSTSRSMMLSS